MNSYKKVNDQIKVSEDLKKKTIEKMSQKKQVSRKPFFALVGGVACILVVCVSLWKPTNLKESEASRNQIFHLTDFLTENTKSSAKNFETEKSEYKNNERLIEMNDRDKAVINQIFPGIQNLLSSSDFNINVKYQYYLEKTEKIPYITIATSNNNIFLFLTSKDTSLCKREIDNLKLYKDYEITVDNEYDGTLHQYTVFIKKGDYIAYGYANVENPMYFEQFLDVFLN